MLILFAAALLGASVDAMACEPEFETAGAVIAHAGDEASRQSDQNDQGDNCTHGHGHTASKAVPKGAGLVLPFLARGKFGFAASALLGSLPSKTPERPPPV